MKYGEVTLGQLIQCLGDDEFEYTAHNGNVGEVLDSLVEQAIDAGLLSYCEDGSVVVHLR